MALAPITLTRETVRLVSPFDPAISKSTPEAALQAYVDLEDLDISRLVFDGDPTIFVVRGLGPRERRAVIASLPPRDSLPPIPAGGIAALPLHERAAIKAWTLEFHVQVARYGLVSVEGLQGWDEATREQHLGLHPWSADSVGALDEPTLGWLGAAIESIGGLTDKKKESSTS